MRIRIKNSEREGEDRQFALMAKLWKAHFLRSESGLAGRRSTSADR